MANLEALGILGLVVRTGSLSGAARTLGTSPASVSRQLSQLEAEFGLQLVNRSSRDISLTDAGQVFLDQAKIVLEEAEKLQLIARENAPGMKGSLHVHARSASGTALVIPMLARFRALYPDITVRMSLADHHPNLVDRNIDLSLVNSLPDSPSLISRKLVSWERRICASPAYLERHGIPGKPEDLQNHRCITYLFNLGITRWRFRQGGATQTVRPASVIETTDSASMQTLALDGLGIIMLPEWYLENDLRHGRLVRLFEDYECAPNMEGGFRAHVWALYHPSRRKSPQLRAFLDLLVTSLKDRPAQAEPG
jgi:DNA-binding transcriptional LysR family regulator